MLRYVHEVLLKSLMRRKKKVFIVISCFRLLQMRKWKAWEKETKTVDYQFSHGRYPVLIYHLKYIRRPFLSSQLAWSFEKKNGYSNQIVEISEERLLASHVTSDNTVKGREKGSYIRDSDQTMFLNHARGCWDMLVCAKSNLIMLINLPLSCNCMKLSNSSLQGVLGSCMIKSL